MPFTSSESIAFSGLDSIPTGERIVYDIKKLYLTVGKATLEYKGMVKLKDRPAVLITLKAEALKFSDYEEIFLDPVTFYPIVIKREVDWLGKKEMILEEYDQKNGIVKITKEVKGKRESQTIEKTAAIDNIYGFIYRYRDKGRFQLGEKLFMNLPTQEVSVTLLNKDNIKIGREKYDAYYMEGEPNGIQIWFSEGRNKFPLKINGAIGFGKTSLVFREKQN